MSRLADGSGDRIEIRGYDLSEQLIGKRSFVEVLFLLCFSRLPEPNEERMVNALLVTVADHGLTPSATAARLTYYGAPESLQGAVAAGLLGAGDQVLGSMSESAEMFRLLASTRPPSVEEHVARELAAGRRIPGFGHPIHEDGDPRVSALESLQRELGIENPHMTIARTVEDVLRTSANKRLPLNAAGAIGAITCDLGLPADFARGLALVARSAGLVAHVLEEQETPMAGSIWRLNRQQ